MQTITTIGFDIAKSIFQVHGVDAGGQVIIRRQLKRRSVLAFFQKLPPCLVGIEACASSHHWSRELQTPVTTRTTMRACPVMGALLSKSLVDVIGVAVDPSRLSRAFCRVLESAPPTSA